MNKEEKKVAVVGGGLVGSLLALGLAKRGFQTDIIEKREDPRQVEHSEGKSINLALSTRGLTSLNNVGGASLMAKVKKIGIPVYGRMIHSKKKGYNTSTADLEFQQYGVLPQQHLLSISRGDLNDLLLDECEQEPGVNILFQENLAHIDLDKTQIKDKNGNVRQYEMIFGADGVYSSVRNAMQHNKGFNFSQQYLDHGYKELLLQADPQFKKEVVSQAESKKEGHLMDSHSLHIWPRGLFMLMGLPNLDGTYTITLFLPHSKFEQLESGTDRSVIQFFEEEFPDFLALIGTDRLVKQFRSNPVGSLLTIQTSPFYRKKSVLIGDAAHGIVPFYGQGMNAGMEDVRVLLRTMDKTGVTSRNLNDGKELNVTEAFKEYYEIRKPNVDTISELSRGNYDEMRDHVNHSDYKFRKKLDDYLFHLTSFIYWRGKASPTIWDVADGDTLVNWTDKVWVPQYSMVSFSNIPYSVLRQKARDQDKMVNDIISFLKTSGKFVSVIGVVGVALLILSKYFPADADASGTGTAPRPPGGRTGAL